jgi:hypothetical protein
MSKSTKLTNAKVKNTSGGWPLVVYVGIFGLGLLGYLISELALGARPHPIHWVVALIGAILGGVLGWVWFRWHGDII